MAMFDGVFIALQIDRAIDRERVFGQMADVLIDLGEQVRADKASPV